MYRLSAPILVFSEIWIKRFKYDAEPMFLVEKLSALKYYRI